MDSSIWQHGNRQLCRCLVDLVRAHMFWTSELQWIFWLKHGVNVIVWSHMGLPTSLDDATQAEWRHVPLGAILLICETPEQLCG